MNALGGAEAGQGATGDSSENGQQHQPGQRPPAANQQQQIHMAMQNPQQMMQVIQAQIAQLQRQWATVQNQPESPQKLEAMQNLGMNMKRMRLLQQQTTLALQNRQQQPIQNQQQSDGAQDASQTTQQGGVSAAPQNLTSEGVASMPLLQANGTTLDASNPAHNAQLAALQSFAQQQRIQAQQHQPREGFDGQPWQQQSTAIPQSQSAPTNGMGAASPPSQSQQLQQQHQFSNPQSAATGQQAQQTSQQQPQQQQFGQSPKGDLVSAVRAFMAARGTPLPGNMSTNFTGPSATSPGEAKSVDLQTLFATVVQFGGSARVSAQPNGWAIVASRLGLSVAPTPTPYNPGQNEVDAKGILLPPFVAPRLSQVFREIFSAFEEFWLAKMRGAGSQTSNGQQQQQQPAPMQQTQQQQPGQNTEVQQRPSSSAGQTQQQTSQQMASQNGTHLQQQQSPPGMPSTTPQVAPGSQASGTVSAQEALQRAQQMQAQLPKQMQQLQEFINGGKMTQQEARDKFTYLQNNAKMAMLQAQAQLQGGPMGLGAAAPSVAATAPPMQQAAGTMTSMQQSLSQSQPVQTTQTPTMQPQQAYAGQLGMSNGGNGHSSSASDVNQMGPPIPQQPQPPLPQSQAASTSQPPTATETKKGTKRPRKSTTTSAKGNANAVAAAANSDINRDTRTASPTQANMAHLTMQAQQAVRVLQQGNMNLSLQVQAFAAIQTARLASQGITGIDVSSISHTMAQIYSQYLRNAQGAGQPMHIAAPLAFSAAEAEMQRTSQGQNQGAQTRPSQSSTPKMQSQQLHQSVPPQSQSSANLQQQQQQQQQPPYLPPQSSSSASASSLRLPSQPISASAQSSLSGPVQVPIQTPTKPNKFKIEYMPIRREVRSHGGWDLDVVERQIGDVLEGKGRYPRSVRELGHVDIEALIMSLRSRLEVEVTYALNALYILTAGVQATGFHLLLSICEDLCDELLDLLGEAAYGKLYKEEDTVEGTQADGTAKHMNGHVNGKVDPPSHSEWMMDIKEEDEEMHLWERRKPKRRKSQSGDESDEVDAPLRQREDLRCAQVALSIIDIFYNLATIDDNQLFLNHEPRFCHLLMKITQSVEQEQTERRNQKNEKIVKMNGNTSMDPSKPKTVFTSTEAMRIRKDILSIIACLSGEAFILTLYEDDTVIAMINLICSFIKDASDLEQEYGTISFEANGMNGSQKPQVVGKKVPQHADMALEAFSSLAQPDVNRELLARLVDESKWVALGENLIKLLPISEVDFQMLKTEARLGYNERIAMSLFNIAYLGSPNVKAELKRASGAIGVIFRCIKRLITVNAYNRNPFAVMTRRLIETLRMLDGGDNFDRPALIGFGMENVSGSSREKVITSRITSGKAIRSGGLLAQDEISVVELMTVEGIDPVIIAELEQLL